MKYWMPPTNEMIEKVMTSVKKQADRQYFFSRLKNPLWVGPLRERGYFKTPPGLNKLPDGYVQYPHWPELRYLVAIAEEVPDQIIEIILSLPKTDNPRVYDDILAIALKIKGQQSASLLPKLIEYIKLDSVFHAHRYPELLKYWTDQGNIAEALEITKFLVAFREDSRRRDKEQLRNKKPKPSGSSLDPTPVFRQSEYRDILVKGIRPLAKVAPYQVSSILIDAVESMIRLGMHAEDYAKGSDQDYSEIWCRRLDKPDREYQGAKETLVQTLTNACEQVYEKATESIEALDQGLRNHRWKVFKRLRQHLYAQHPNDQTLPWIREQILDHNDYHRWEHHYEFQLMIRKASEHFGSELLSEDELNKVLFAILSGPSKQQFRDWMGDGYTDEAFQQRQRHFHYMQLRPFASLLSGKYLSYYDELKRDASPESICDDDYSPDGMVSSGFISSRSPKDIEDLESLKDDKILCYINDWDEEYRDKDDWLAEINISALANVFQSLFKEKIVPDGERLAFWLANRNKIARPVYINAMLKAMMDLVKEKDFNNLEQWIAFCAWVLTHPDTPRVEGLPTPRDESRDHPDWGSTRRAVVDFIDACVNKESGVPIVARNGLATLLKQACCQPDWQLDYDRPVLLNREDHIIEAINNTRSRALESLVNFGFWVRRQLSEDQLPEVIDILDHRLAQDAEIPLTRPEYALLGMHFGSLCTLNPKWAAQKRSTIFPQVNTIIWSAAFGSYIRFNQPYKLTFEILRGEFEFALDNLNILTTDKRDGIELIDRLGQHLFTYYIWEIYPLTGDQSLLERYYLKTKDNRERWVKLFDNIGRSLSNSDRQMSQSLIKRITAFFDWRFDTAEPKELQHFAFWLEAECLDPAWRLHSYSKILDLDKANDNLSFFVVPNLTKLLPDNLRLVVECFKKLTDILDENSQLYVTIDEARPILLAGLASDIPEIRKNAEHAREKLLRLGRFDFLDAE